MNVNSWTVLRRAGHEPVLVLGVLVTGHDGKPIVRLVFQVGGDALPRHPAGARHRRQRGVVPVVVVQRQAGLLVDGVGQHGVGQLPDTGVGVVRLGAGAVVLDQGQGGIGLEGDREHAGLAGVVVDRVVPAVDEKAGDRDLVVRAVGDAHPLVVVRNRQREQQAPRVVPVVLRLDDLVAERGHELAEVELQGALGRSEIAQIGLLDGLIDRRPGRLGATNHRCGRSVVQIDPEAAAAAVGRLLFHRDLGQVEAERVMRDREILKAVEDLHAPDRPARFGGLVEVVGVVGVDEARELDVPEERHGGRILLGGDFSRRRRRRRRRGLIPGFGRFGRRLRVGSWRGCGRGRVRHGDLQSPCHQLLGRRRRGDGRRE